MNKVFFSGVLVLSFFSTATVFAQAIGWQNKDRSTDTVFGMSVDKAYKEVLQGKKSKTVVIAVMDSGVDTTHEDLSSILWHNIREIPANGKDDDRNGYVDDKYGWDFIGGPKEDVWYDNLEMTRIIREKGAFYDSLAFTRVPQRYLNDYAAYRKMKAVFDQKLSSARAGLEKTSNVLRGVDSVCRKLGASSPTVEQVTTYKPGDEFLASIKRGMLRYLATNQPIDSLRSGLKRDLEFFHLQTDYQLNVSFDPRAIVGDNYADVNQRYYGNNDVYGPHALHGTHVIGIIAAVRNNGIGMDGIADNVRVMMVRMVPHGDERDKDVANGIRYAVDNGAKVINMSFGKSYATEKKAVDEAVKYAMSKDVLIIHASGNDGLDLDLPENRVFPNPVYADGSGRARAWIEVGASAAKDDTTLVAPFSNYGKTVVDVFAPGVHIYSAIPGSKYAFENGTSMAAPMVTGVAALIREYYPKLTALEVKDIIMRSVVKPGHPVRVIKDSKSVMVSMNDICASGGIVNAFEALRLAAAYKN